MAMVPRSSPLAEKESVTVEELTEYPIITTMEKSDEDLYRIFGPSNLKPNIKYRIKSESTIVSMVHHELGIAIMSELYMQNLPRNVVAKRIDAEHTVRGIGVALPSMETASPSARLFIQYLTEMNKTQNWREN